MMNILFPYQSKALYVVSLRRPTVAFLLKPFMWCRSDARLWHYYFAFSARGVFQTLVWHQYYYSAFSARGVFQTLVWHQYFYSVFFRSRSLSDTRLAPVLLFSIFRSRSLSDTRLAPSIITSMSDRTGYLSMYLMLAFVISYVRTVLRVLSKYSLAC